MRPHPLDHIPTLEAAERFELSSSYVRPEVEARCIVPLCYAASLLTNSGAGCGNRTHFVSLKRRVHIHICQSRHRNLVGDAGIEPAWSRLRGECISHLCQSPLLQQHGAGCWNRTNASRLSTADSHPSTRNARVLGTPGLDLRANPRPFDHFAPLSCSGQAMVRRSGVEPASVGCRPTILVR